MQEKYWHYMVQIKFSIYYLDFYAEDSYKWERKINVVNAIASSGSIAAWAMWDQISFIWAIIIALSQVLAVVKKYLPFNKRLEIIKPYTDELKYLYNRIEYDWYNVASGELSENQINKLLYEYKRMYIEIENKNLKAVTLLENKKISNLADEKTNIYFEKNF